MRKISLNDFRTANHNVIRDINEIIVLNLIRERQPIARIEIAQITGLKAGTISRIVERFVLKDLVYETGARASTSSRGPKPRFLHINPTKSYAIGVSIGPTQTLLALSDFSGHLRQFKKLTTTRDPEHFLAEVADEILSLMNTTHRYYTELGGLGVSLVGLVNTEEGTIVEGENMGWGENIEVGRILKSGIGQDIPVYFENSARLAALGEIWFGTMRLSGFRNIVYLDISEGVGTGVIVNGQIYRGSRNGAGEFGHICIDPAGPKCSCGSYGCLEAFASDTATTNRYLEKIKAKDNSHLADNGKIDVATIIELAKNGHPHALETVKETARYLGWGLAPIIYALNPDAIVIGGRVAEAWSLIEKEIFDSCANRVSAPFLGSTKILPSTLHVSPDLMGAIALVLAKHFAAPEII